MSFVKEARDGVSSIESMENTLDAKENHIAHKRVASNLSSYVNMTNTSVGVGVLGLPYAFASSGFILGPIFLGVAMVIAWAGLHLLACVAAKTGYPCTFYSCYRPVNKYLPVVFDAVVVLTLLGASCAYLIVIGDLMPSVLLQMGYAGFWTKRFVWVLIGFSAAAPFSLPHQIDFLKFTSALCVLFIAYVAAAILTYAIPNSAAGDPCNNQILADDSLPCNGGYVTFQGITTLGVLKVLSIFFFGFCCHVSAFPILTEAKNASVENMDKVWASVLITCGILYFTIAAGAYYTYGSSARSDILLNYPVDATMTVARLMVTFIVVFSYPLQANPARRSALTILHALLDGDEEPSASATRFRYVLVTFFYLTFTLLVALTVEDLGVVIAVSGATGATIIMFLVPGGLYLFHFPQHEEEEDADDVKQQLLTSNNSSSHSNVLLECEDSLQATGLHEGLVPEIFESNDGGGGGGGTDKILKYLVKDVPIPKVSRFWRAVAWVQVILGLILVPLTLTAIFI